MIKICNERVMITMNSNLLWKLRKLAKSQNTTLSKLISSLCNNKANRLYEKLTMIENEQDIDTILEIARAKWIDD